MSGCTSASDIHTCLFTNLCLCNVYPRYILVCYSTHINLISLYTQVLCIYIYITALCNDRSFPTGAMYMQYMALVGKDLLLYIIIIIDRYLHILVTLLYSCRRCPVQYQLQRQNVFIEEFKDPIIGDSSLHLQRISQLKKQSYLYLLLTQMLL